MATGGRGDDGQGGTDRAGEELVQKKRIFLADDSITIQRVVELAFTEANYDVVCAGSGAEALLQLGKVDADIALIDVHMPDKSGYEVCAQVKGNPELAWMPVLLLTGTFEHYDESRAREAGADGHITKPFESRGLLARVDEILASHPRPAPRRDPQPRVSIPGAAGTVRPPAPGIHAEPIRSEPSAGPALKPAEPRRAPASESEKPSRTTPVTPSQREGGNGASGRVVVPQEMLEGAVREAVAGISEAVIREVAWQVIPDLAEAIIRKRIQELEEEAVSGA